MFSKRPIAVDWAVPKNLYNGAADAATAPEDGKFTVLFSIVGNLNNILDDLKLFVVILYIRYGNLLLTR